MTVALVQSINEFAFRLYATLSEAEEEVNSKY